MKRVFIGIIVWQVVTSLSSCATALQKEKASSDAQKPEPIEVLQLKDIDDPYDYLDTAFQIQHLYFDVDKAIIPDVSKDELDELVDILTTYPEMKLEIHGHTDVTGDWDANVALSKNRAESVKAYLVDKGIDPKRVYTFGHGPEIPLMEGDFEEAYQYNRRVEFEYTLK
ncbi:OmpA family protein [Parvicella tangerina]|uniref:Peptidoglycan-associated lipoprotein n=1 Tax=Parvicella tangerina TaxID=2829795 RepID=A0A916NR83_9FLAO|nr:OmpA family protein [Parvicella tangerina]CAG5080580.1 Peptidoglycan-associated lipoprotein [Parvicella tangerina]